ncbi:hypothetical protein GCM10009733_041450 [Nonomuraea maheshkhaliensis]|uniref:UspA domain-containing protein n=1 Tax=Nonomuraea maheshkhaliensis TaxID=419590 RepID=A0ABP4RAJ4_9ACTN
MIIVGVDGSAPSRAAVEWAADDAARMGLPLRIVHVMDTSWYLVGRRPDAALPDALLTTSSAAVGSPARCWAR